MRKYLLADLGGTNARFLILRSLKEGINPQKVLILKSSDWSSFPELLGEVLSRFGLSSLKLTTCIAVAGPVVKGKAKLSNLGWEISKSQIKKGLAFREVYLVNDLQGGAASLVGLTSKDLLKLKSGDLKIYPRVSVFCGTGLGVGVVIRKKPLTLLPTEAGHTNFPALNQWEEAFLGFLSKKKKELSWEEILSARGLENLYEFLFNERRPSLEITTLSKKGEVKSTETVQSYLRLLGRFVGQVALSYLPLGGVYLGGGIIEGMKDFLQEEKLSQAFYLGFYSYPKLNYLLKEIPLYVILHPFPVLLGCKTILQSLQR